MHALSNYDKVVMSSRAHRPDYVYISDGTSEERSRPFLGKLANEPISDAPE
jgi:hypothetical protein